MKKKYIFVSSILILIIFTVGASILNNNSKTDAINNHKDLVETVLKAIKEKDLQTLQYFNCRITKDHQEQDDFDRALADYLEYSKKFNYTESKIIQIDETNFEINNLKNLESGKKISKFLKINKQKPLYSELRTKESYCFE